MWPWEPPARWAGASPCGQPDSLVVWLPWALARTRPYSLEPMDAEERTTLY